MLHQLGKQEPSDIYFASANMRVKINTASDKDMAIQGVLEVNPRVFGYRRTNCFPVEIQVTNPAVANPINAFRPMKSCDHCESASNH